MEFGTAVIPLTLNTILERVSEYDIFSHYLGHSFKLRVPFRSPFHKDDNPSASIIRTAKGRLHFTVFGKEQYSGKVIDFVRNFYPGYNYDQILKTIDRDLNLGIREGKPATRKAVLTFIHEEENVGPRLIQVVARSFDSFDMDFWRRFHLDKMDLQKPPTLYRIKEVYIDKELFPIDPDEHAYGYYFGQGMWKIYRPFARLKMYKWRCNIPGDFLFGLDKLDESKPVIQIKAGKCFKVATKCYKNCYLAPFEGLNIINETNLKFLLRFSRILLCNDPDPAGIASTQRYLSVDKKFRPFEVPTNLISLPVTKDLSDIARDYGLETVNEIIKNNIAKL